MSDLYLVEGAKLHKDLLVELLVKLKDGD